MKKLRIVITILFLSFILVGMNSCLVARHTDRGEHRGWFHKQHNPHHRGGAVLIITPEQRNAGDKHTPADVDRD